MDWIILAVAFLGGLFAHLIKLPPMVGFLAAGFALNGLGYSSNPILTQMADLGVTLLLFTIGLKLNVKDLLRKEIWAGATAHMLITTVFLAGILALVKLAGVALLAGLDNQTLMLLGFALSFSSTVFAVKLLESRSEANSLYGRVAIGILIMQDIFAVVFLTASTGKIPSPWAVTVLAMPLLRPIFARILDHIGHGELQTLFALFGALVLGATWFELVGLKPDLGALIIGIILAPLAGSAGLAKALFNIKDMLLVVFFLNIGLTGMPSESHLWIAMLLLVALLAKTGLYYLIFQRFHFRARTSLRGSFTLANYSEFGLIVAALATKNGWLSSDWLVILAITVSLSFVFSSLLNVNVDRFYDKYRLMLKRWQRYPLQEQDRPIELGNAEVLVFGMGRVGTGAYDVMRETFGDVVLGVEVDIAKAAAHQQEGRNVVSGDAQDSDFWQRLSRTEGFKLILLAMPDHSGNLHALNYIRRAGIEAQVAAIARFADEINDLQTQGVQAVFNLYDEAGSGFAHHILACCDGKLGQVLDVSQSGTTNSQAVHSS